MRCRAARPMGISGERGLTLVELLLAAALLGMVLGGILQYWEYANRSWQRTAAAARALQEARLVILRMEGEVRRAQKAMQTKKAIHLVSSGQVEIYTDVTGDGKPELVVYLLQEGALRRGVAAPLGDGYPYTYGAPSQWETVVSRVLNTVEPPLFSLDTSHDPRLTLTVTILVGDSQVSLDRPITVQAALTVRGRGETR